MRDRPNEYADLRDYAERFAEILIASGLRRMASRVFSYILADDAADYTAAELAEGLDVSLAAISGAVRELADMGLLFKSRRPGTRADVYQLNDDDIWGKIMLDRTPLLMRYQEVALEGVRTLPPGAGRDRLQQTADYMDFVNIEMTAMRERWTEHRKRQREQREATDE